MRSLPSLKAQEIPLDHPDSNNMFQPGPEKPLVATRSAIEKYSFEVILACWEVLRQKADEHHGLDYLQVFESEEVDEELWFIEDGPGGAITALLPSDYWNCMHSSRKNRQGIHPLESRHGMHDLSQTDRMLVPSVERPIRQFEMTRSVKTLLPRKLRHFRLEKQCLAAAPGYGRRSGHVLRRTLSQGFSSVPGLTPALGVRHDFLDAD
ncbi:MAG: hypothetical protein U1D30_06855 [Planctomycetota bacterium]